jgi:hypothetical protein
MAYPVDPVLESTLRGGRGDGVALLEPREVAEWPAEPDGPSIEDADAGLARQRGVPAVSGSGAQVTGCGTLHHHVAQADVRRLDQGDRGSWLDVAADRLGAKRQLLAQLSIEELLLACRL